MQRFGEKLRTLREGRALSYRKLAAELGVAHTHIANIENGARTPSAELIVKIARYFQVSFDQLMDDNVELE